MDDLQGGSLGVVGNFIVLFRVAYVGCGREEAEDGLAEFLRNVPFHLRVRAAGYALRALLWLGAEEKADDADDGVGLFDPLRQHGLDLAVVGRKAGLVLGETALHLDLVFHGPAEGGELPGDATEEDRGPSFHLLIGTRPRGRGLHRQVLRRMKQRTRNLRIDGSISTSRRRIVLRQQEGQPAASLAQSMLCCFDRMARAQGGLIPLPYQGGGKGEVALSASNLP
jgi:hypothetical protein